MTSKIETTRIAMFDAFTAMKAGGRWLVKKANCEAFESALEEHLFALELRHRQADKLHSALQDGSRVYLDAYEHQVGLTHKACVAQRETSDDLFETKRLLAMADRDCGEAQAIVDQQKERIHQQKVLIAAQRQAIGQLYMVKSVMSKQIVQLVEEVEVLKMDNKVSGELLRGREVSVGYPVTMALVGCNEKA